MKPRAPLRHDADRNAQIKISRLRLPKAMRVAAAALLATAVAACADVIYVSTGDNTISQYMPDGTGSVFATGLSSPEGMAFDSAGNLYVANYGNNSITKFTPGGVRSTFASTGLTQPLALACDSAGNVYVSNQGSYDYGRQVYHSYIQKFTPNGVGSFFADATGRDPDGLACDSAGNLFAAFRINLPAIMKFTPGGAGSVFASTTTAAQGLAFDPAGNLYASYGPLGTIGKFSSTGASLGIFASGMSNPIGLAFDRDGNLYAANFVGGGGYIEKISPGGTGSVFATGLDYPVFVATIPEPSSGALLGLGIAVMLLFRVRRGHNRHERVLGIVPPAGCHSGNTLFLR